MKEKHDLWAPKREARDILQAFGFTPPPTTFTKPDPRGKEYGEFVVSIINPNCGTIHHTLDGWTLQWNSLDDLEDFITAKA